VAGNRTDTLLRPKRQQLRLASTRGRSGCEWGMRAGRRRGELCVAGVVVVEEKRWERGRGRDF
jgi:hypothetical protein